MIESDLIYFYENDTVFRGWKGHSQTYTTDSEKIFDTILFYLLKWAEDYDTFNGNIINGADYDVPNVF